MLVSKLIPPQYNHVKLRYILVCGIIYCSVHPYTCYVFPRSAKPVKSCRFVTLVTTRPYDCPCVYKGWALVEEAVTIYIGKL